MPFDNRTILESSIGTILKSSIGTMLESSIGTMLESSIGTMLESSTESVLHFDIHSTPIQCRKPMSFRHWNVGCRHRNDIVPILEPHLGGLESQRNRKRLFSTERFSNSLNIWIQLHYLRYKSLKLSTRTPVDNISYLIHD